MYLCGSFQLNCFVCNNAREYCVSQIVNIRLTVRSLIRHKLTFVPSYVRTKLFANLKTVVLNEPGYKRETIKTEKSEP